MNDQDFLAERFEEHRPHLEAVAYRMLGSVSEAGDAVQEAWLRLCRSETSGVENLGGWLTTVVGRVALNMLKSRKSRREHPLEVYVPDPIVADPDGSDPEHEAVLSDSVGLALLVVLDTLTPAERLAFVLHDMFALPFDDIAPIVGRSPAAARQLASRARRRVRGATPAPDVGMVDRRRLVDAFLAAAREGDFDALVTLLDPDVVLRADAGDAGAGSGGISQLVRGASAVAREALLHARLAKFARPVLVNGTPGVITAPNGRLAAVMGFAVSGGLIVEIDILVDPERLRRIDVTLPED